MPPIQIDELETQVDVRGPDEARAPERQQPPPEALPRWQQLRLRDDELRQRVSAWNHED
jgi:hypothetical protein